MGSYYPLRIALQQPFGRLIKSYHFQTFTKRERDDFFHASHYVHTHRAFPAPPAPYPPRFATLGDQTQMKCDGLAVDFDGNGGRLDTHVLNLERGKMLRLGGHEGAQQRLALRSGGEM